MTKRDEFIEAFRQAAGIETTQRASEQWDEFSRNQSDSMIESIERGGAESGAMEGELWRELFA